MATTTKCKKCGCEDSFLISPAPCPTPEGCPNPEPCSEVFDAQCVKYTGPDILCDQDLVVATNDSISDALVNIVDQFCVQDSYVQNVQLQGTNLVFTGLGLAFDGTVDLSSIGAGVTADNGLTMSTPTNVRLGGLLLQDTTITTQDYNFNVIGNRGNAGDTVMYIENTGQGAGITVLSISNTSVGGYSTNAAGGYFTSQTNSALYTVTSNFNNPGINASNNGLLANGRPIGLSLTTLTTSPLPADGIGNKIQYVLSHNDSGTNTLTDSNEILSTFTDVLSATLTSDLIFRGRYNGSAMSDLVTFKGVGEVQFHEYGVGNFVNAPAYMLGVDASGNVVEVAL